MAQEQRVPTAIGEPVVAGREPEGVKVRLGQPPGHIPDPSPRVHTARTAGAVEAVERTLSSSMGSPSTRRTSGALPVRAVPAAVATIVVCCDEWWCKQRPGGSLAARRGRVQPSP